MLDLAGRRLIARRDPDTIAGAYRVELKFGESESVSPLERPGYRIAVSGLLA